MTAIRRQIVDQAFDWFPRKTEQPASRVAPEILPGVFRLPVPVPARPRPKDAEAGGERHGAEPAQHGAETETLGDVLVQIGEPNVLREDVVGTWAEDYDASDHHPAPYAWVGMLICAFTAGMTATGLLLIVI